MSMVPRMRQDEEDGDFDERLQEYISAIRATVQVFKTSNHKSATLAEYDRYMVWIDAWCIISGFGSYVVADLTVRLRLSERAPERAKEPSGRTGVPAWRVCVPLPVSADRERARSPVCVIVLMAACLIAFAEGAG